MNVGWPLDAQSQAWDHREQFHDKRSCSLFVVVFPGDKGAHLAGFEVVAASVEAGQISAVNMDLDRGPIGVVVHLVYLVDIGHQQRDPAGVEVADTVSLKQGVLGIGPIVQAVEAGLGKAIVHHSYHTPGVVVVGRGVIAWASHHRGDKEPTVAAV